MKIEIYWISLIIKIKIKFLLWSCNIHCLCSSLIIVFWKIMSVKTGWFFFQCMTKIRNRKNNFFRGKWGCCYKNIGILRCLHNIWFTHGHEFSGVNLNLILDNKFKYSMVIHMNLFHFSDELRIYRFWSFSKLIKYLWTDVKHDIFFDNIDIQYIFGIINGWPKKSFERRFRFVSWLKYLITSLI